MVAHPTTQTQAPAKPTPAEQLLATVRVLPSGKEIRITPSDVARRAFDCPPEIIPRFGIFAWQPAGDGTYSPRILVHECWVRLLTLARHLNMEVNSMRRLCWAGFIKWNQPTPGLFQCEIHSVLAHFEAAKDPEFWTEARRRQYQAAL